MTLCPAPEPDTHEILWRGPLFDATGYGDECRGFLLGLEALGVPLAARLFGRVSDRLRRSVTRGDLERLDALLARPYGARPVSVFHGSPSALALAPGAPRHVGRTMFESDGLPSDHVAACNRMDEIWVPAAFNRGTFERAGVRVPIFVVPAGVDALRFQPGVDPLPIRGRRRTAFVSVFEWRFRKGWDVLLTAWQRAFGPDDDVCLVLRPTRPELLDRSDGSGTDERIECFLQGLGRSRASVAPIVVLREFLPDADMPRLYAAATALVAPSRGEGWGRPQLEAMACGRPVIATRWGGHLEFMGEANSLLLDVEALEAVDERCEMDVYRGQNWARPSVEHLVALMQGVARDPGPAAARAAQARADVLSSWTWDRACRGVLERLQQVPVRSPQVVVQWQSPPPERTSFALLDRELRGRLGLDRRLRVDEWPAADSNPAGAEPQPGLRVQHVPTLDCDHPPDVAILHWDHGSLPRAWVDALRQTQVWVVSRFVRDGAVRSGLAPEQVVVLPPGVDFARFHPERAPLALRTRKRFRFLFVGGCVRRKGIDLLLQAYLRAFRADDDVCLVIKDAPPDSVYAGRTEAETIRRLQALPGAPEIEYVEAGLDDEALAGLYAACHCLVHPFRGEALGLVLLEAIATGLPLIVTGAGPALEVCRDDDAYLVPAREVRREESQVGDWRTVERPVLFEPDLDALQRILREVASRPAEARERGRRCRERLLASRSWPLAAGQAAERLLALGSPAARAGSRPPLWVLEWRSIRVHIDATDGFRCRAEPGTGPMGTPPVGADAIVAGAAHMLGLSAQRTPAEGVAPDIALNRTRSGYRVAAAARVVDCPTLEDAIVNLAARVCDAFAARTEAALIHAGAFLGPAGAVLFVGRERAGKTTLAHEAWRQGLRVLGDDITVLEPDDAVAAFPKALALRLADGDPGPALPAGHSACGRAEGERRRLISRTLPGFAALEERHPVALLALLTRVDTGGSVVCRDVDPQVALATLTQAGTIVPPRGLRMIRLLRSLHERGRLVEVQVGPEATAVAVERLVEAAAAPASRGGR